MSFMSKINMILSSKALCIKTDFYTVLFSEERDVITSYSIHYTKLYDNKAILAANNPYIIQIDGDIVLDAHFIEDHLRFASYNFV